MEHVCFRRSVVRHRRWPARCWSTSLSLHWRASLSINWSPRETSERMNRCCHGRCWADRWPCFRMFVEENCLAMSCPRFMKTRWTSKLEAMPNVRLQRMPESNRPFSTSTFVSPRETHLNGLESSSSGWEPCVRTQLTSSGRIKEKNCLPVHNGLGFKTAAWGICPFHEGRNINRCRKSLFSMNTSQRVIFLTAVSVSWTIPISGRFDSIEE